MTKPTENDSTKLQANSVPVETREASSRNAVTVLKAKTRARRRATGPRTAIGKQRSSRNAIKYGIFSKGLLVGDESSDEFEHLVKGLHNDWQPEGTLETVLVEKLATIIWRQRRLLRAESAEIDEPIQHSVNNCVTAGIGEAWECERSGETSGGLLKHLDNPRLLRNVVEMLMVVRLGIESSGFCKDPWILRKIYGLDHDDSAPFGTPFQVYLHMADEAAEHAKGIPGCESLEDLKSKMFMILDNEIKRVEALAEQALRMKIEKAEFGKIAALVPPPAVSERLLRYETHLSRELDRTLAQLERLQRMRLGQPVPPPISVRLSG